MNTRELHRIAFMLGYDYGESSTVKRFQILYQHITGIAIEEVPDNFDDGLRVIRKLGIKSFTRVMESGERWFHLSVNARALLLPEELQKKILGDDIPYKRIYGDLLSSRTRYALNYFLEYPLADVINSKLVEISRHLYDNSVNGKQFDTKKINANLVSEGIIMITDVMRTIVEIVPLEQMDKISSNVIRRVSLKSRVKAALYLSPLLVFLPILLTGVNGLFSLEDDIVTLALQFSGLLPALVVVIKFLYEYLIPRGERNELLAQLEGINTAKLFMELFNFRLERKREESPDRYGDSINARRIIRIFDWIDFRVSYPVSMYLMTSDKIGSWKDYAAQFKGITGRVPI